MTTFKTLVKTTLTPIALCLSLAIVAPAIAKKGHHQPHDGMRQILSELSLTDTQKQDIKQILKQNREDRELYSTDGKSLKTDMRSLIQSSEWDEEAVETAIAQRQVLMQQKALQRATNKNQVWNLLTATQQAEFVTQLETRKAKHEEKSSERKEKRKGKGKHKGNMLKRLDLTEEQLAAVKTIKTAEKESAETIRAKLKNFKQAEQSLIQSTEFKAETWEALNSEYQSDFVAMALLKTKSKHDIWNTLTPEQQALAMEKTEKCKGKKGAKKGNKKNRQESV
ncbi:Spy/CpxP family protein refolding chaperone [uncultured Paraglaciecola sp.]|uniref:Spy/CpxP family protein refolding chaperone n=1 Tax=uncultured Paraglaciecola sp. TaxID=1765024 RepID=UPI0030D92330